MRVRDAWDDDDEDNAGAAFQANRAAGPSSASLPAAAAAGARVKILRRGADSPSSSASSSPSLSAASQAKTAEEREAEYARARAAIFGGEPPQPPTQRTAQPRGLTGSASNGNIAAAPRLPSTSPPPRNSVDPVSDDRRDEDSIPSSASLPAPARGPSPRSTSPSSHPIIAELVSQGGRAQGRERGGGRGGQGGGGGQRRRAAGGADEFHRSSAPYRARDSFSSQQLPPTHIPPSYYDPQQDPYNAYTPYRQAMSAGREDFAVQELQHAPPPQPSGPGRWDEEEFPSLGAQRRGDGGRQK